MKKLNRASKAAILWKLKGTEKILGFSTTKLRSGTEISILSFDFRKSLAGRFFISRNKEHMSDFSFDNSVYLLEKHHYFLYKNKVIFIYSNEKIGF